MGPIPLTYTSLGLWEEIWRKPPRTDTGRMCKLHTDSDPSRESHPGPWSCEAAVLITVTGGVIEGKGRTGFGDGLG